MSDRVLEERSFQHCSLAKIQHELGFSSALFNTIIIIQRNSDGDAKADGLIFKSVSGQDPTEYDVALSISFDDASIVASFDCNSFFLTPAQADRVLSLFSSTVAALSSANDTLDMISAEDLQSIWNINTPALQRVEMCVHDIFAQTALQQPRAQAVCAWDVNFSYRELDRLSTRLAAKLAGPVGRDFVVPLCFTKSKWVPVALMGVMKAVGALVAIDTRMPKERLQMIAETINCSVVPAEPAQEALAREMCPHGTVVIVDYAHLLQQLPPQKSMYTSRQKTFCMLSSHRDPPANRRVLASLTAISPVPSACSSQSSASTRLRGYMI